jgi:hypothetical protein
MADATPYSPATITNGLNTGWFDLRPVNGEVLLMATVTGTATFVIDISNDERTDVTKDFQTSISYTNSIAKLISGAKPRFVRVRQTAGTGSVAVSLGKAENYSGKLSEVNLQSEHE